MKNIIFLALIVAFVLVSCNQKNKQVETVSTPMENNSTMMKNDSTMTGSDSIVTGNHSKVMHENSKIYSCPMHPEVHGKLNDKCPKCGMKLNVEVKNK